MRLTSGEKAARKLNRGRQIFLYVAPFPALVFFKIWAFTARDPGSLLVASAAMLAYCSLCLALAFRWDKPAYFDWAVWGYFLAITLLLALWQNATAPIIVEYAVTGIYLCLFSAAFFPPIFGFDPFTYHYARKSAPRAIWSTSIFVTINRIMTFAWAGIFAVCILLSLYPSVVTRALVPISIILGVGIPFNLWFPDWYLRRLGMPTIAEMRKFSQLSATAATDVSENEARASSAAIQVEPSKASGSPKSTGGQGGSIVQLSAERSAVMKVIAINSSARADGITKTGMLLDALVLGMREAGAEVETVNLRQKKINNCIGCFTCWTKTPGICVHKDDMTNELFPKWLDADIAVYATPLYHYTVNAAMKAFLERTLPILEPFLLPHEGRTRHPLRQKWPESVVLSVAGFTEASVFSQISAYVNFLFGTGLRAEIYRPGAEAMTRPEYGETVKDILDATAAAGRSLVESRKISEETMQRIAQPIGDRDTYEKMANVFWKTCIKEGVSPKEFEQKNMVPRPDSLETFMMVMSSGFNSTNAVGTNAVLQFDFSGEVEGSCSFKIENGTIKATEGRSEKPDLTIQSPFDIWMDVTTGKADGQRMFMEQKSKVSGDLSLLIRMKDLFGKG